MVQNHFNIVSDAADGARVYGGAEEFPGSEEEQGCSSGPG